MTDASKWTRKSLSYPQWFIDRLIYDSDKELARQNKLSSSDKVVIRCQNCDNILERLVYNVVSKKTGQPTRPCLCRQCYDKWNNGHLEDTRNKWEEDRIEKRKNQNIPDVVLNSLTEEFRVLLQNGLLDHHRNVDFICSECNSIYSMSFNSRWNHNLTEKQINLCPSCMKTHYNQLIEECRKEGRYYTEEFINSLYYDNDKIKARNKELLTTDKGYFRCSSCGSIVTKYIPQVYNMSNGAMKCKIFCDNCSPREHSPLEDSIIEYLKAITNTQLIYNTRELIRNPNTHSKLELDIYIPDYKLAIEVNGSYWHSTFGSSNYTVNKTYHFLKYKLCKEQGIHLISIFDIDWWYRQDKVKAILSSILTKPQIIYARNTVVSPIDKSIGREFLNQYHLDGDTRQSLYYYGLYSKDNTLLSVMAFGKLRGQNTLHAKENHYELTRFATIPNTKIIGGASKLLKAFEREYHPEYLLVYSDNDYFTGNVYSQLGFSFSKYTDPDYYWYTPVGNEYLNRWQCQPKKLKEKYPDIASKYTTAIEDNVMTELGYLKVYRTGQSVWKKNN